MTAYYNEIDPFCVEWLKNLIAAGLIAPGDVDDRDIRDVSPDDLRGYDQCHFFAGIGVWSYALRQAGWPDDRPVWTGSCPCQPFSAAGKGAGFDDERHLWPAFFHLIEQCQPPTVFGEQVASKDGLAWLDLVYADMEGAGYAFWPFDFCAASVGAPHQRQRLYFVADSASPWGCGWEQGRTGRYSELRGSGEVSGLADTHSNGCAEVITRSNGAEETFPVVDRQGIISPRQPRGASNTVLAVGDTNDSGPQGRRISAERAREFFAGQAGVAGFWGDADWIWCRDQKYRPVEPGTFPLVDESPARVGRLRGYGNAIVADQAKEFVTAFLQSESDSLKVN